MRDGGGCDDGNATGEVCFANSNHACIGQVGGIDSCWLRFVQKIWSGGWHGADIRQQALGPCKVGFDQCPPHQHVDRFQSGEHNIDPIPEGETTFADAYIGFLFQHVFDIRCSPPVLRFVSERDLLGMTADGRDAFDFIPSCYRNSAGEPVDLRPYPDAVYHHHGDMNCEPVITELDQVKVDWPAAEDISAAILPSNTGGIPDCDMRQVLAFCDNALDSSQTMTKALRRVHDSSTSILSFRLFRERRPSAGQHSVYVAVNVDSSYKTEHASPSYAEHPGRRAKHYAVRLVLKTKVTPLGEVIDSVVAAQCHCYARAVTCTHKVAALVSLMLLRNDSAAVERAKNRKEFESRAVRMAEIYDMLRSGREKPGNILNDIKDARAAAGLPTCDDIVEREFVEASDSRSNHKNILASSQRAWDSHCTAPDGKSAAIATHVWALLLQLVMEADPTMSKRVVLPYRDGDLAPPMHVWVLAQWEQIRPHGTCKSDWMPHIRNAFWAKFPWLKQSLDD